MPFQDHTTFLSIANRIANRSNCIRRNVGALIVRDGQVLAEGWNGVSAYHLDCREAGCPRCINGGSTGSGYETCICIHAEQRAIADAARRGISTQDTILYVNLRPCLQCLVTAKAAGIRDVFFCGEDWTYSSETEEVYRTFSREFDAFSRVEGVRGSEMAKGSH